MSIKVGGKEYTGFWAGVFGLFITFWTLIFVSIILFFTAIIIFAPLLIPVIIGVLIGKVL